MGRPRIDFGNSRHDRKIVYMCGNDFVEELGSPSGGALFDDVEILKERRTCWRECGILELEITPKRYIEDAGRS
jgi:hypothetical protein